MTAPQPVYDLSWHRDGAAWVLLHRRRRMGRVIPDSSPGMWRAVRHDRSLSDMASLSWAKNALLVAAELELAFEDRLRCAS